MASIGFTSSCFDRNWSVFAASVRATAANRRSAPILTRVAMAMTRLPALRGHDRVRSTLAARVAVASAGSSLVGDDVAARVELDVAARADHLLEHPPASLHARLG